MRKKWIVIICAILIMVCTITAPVYAAGIFLPEESNTRQAESTDLIEAPSGILMEAQTGTVVYQKDADTRRSPASITKIMTLILIFDALDKRQPEKWTTQSQPVPHAKSMGGSQVFLEEGGNPDSGNPDQMHCDRVRKRCQRSNGRAYLRQ